MNDQTRPSLTQPRALEPTLKAWWRDRTPRARWIIGSVTGVFIACCALGGIGAALSPPPPEAKTPSQAHVATHTPTRLPARTPRGAAPTQTLCQFMAESAPPHHGETAPARYGQCAPHTRRCGQERSELP